MRQHIALAGVASGNILIGLLYTLAVIQVRGVGSESDAYFFTTALATFFLAVFSGPVANVVTAKLASSQSGREWRALAWAGHVSALLIYLPVVLLVTITSDWWLGTILPGMRNAELYKEILLIQMAAMFFTGLQASALAAVQSQKKFLFAEVVLLASAVLFYFPFIHQLEEHGVVAASEVQLLRAAAQLAVFLGLSGIPEWLGIRTTVGDITRQFQLPVLGGAYYKTDALLDRYLLAHAKDGVMSIYHLVQQVITIIATLYARSFVSPLLVKASEDISTRQIRQLRIRIITHLKISVYIMLACMVAVGAGGLLANPIGQLLNLPPDLLMNAATVFMTLSGVLLGGLMGQVSNTVFYATGRLSMAVGTGVTSYTLFIPLKILGFSMGGITGLSIVASLYYLVNAGVLFTLQSRLLKEYE